MTRIALIADIHGNAVALRRALEEIGRLGAERIVCLGDVAAGGPQAREVVQELRAREIASVMGNADDEILNPTDPSQVEGDLVKILEICSWNATQLGEDDLAYMAGFAPTLTLEEGGEVLALCAHGSPRSFDEIVHAASSAEELDAAMAGVDAPLVVVAHTHFPFMRRHRGLLIVNPGSVGRAYDPAPPADDIRFVPYAEFGILERDGDRFSWHFHRVPFDVEDLLDAVRTSGMPHAEWLAGMWRRG